MLLLAHSGLTLGAATLLYSTLLRDRSHDPVPTASGNTAPSPDRVSRNLASWFASLGNRIDIRVLLIASLLPDIVDKPVGQLIFKDTFNNGRIFGHTLLFLALVTIAGLYLHRRYRKSWPLVFPFGILTHLLLDEMWLLPKTLLWPLYGITFDRGAPGIWYQNLLQALTHDPVTIVSETTGAAVLILFVWTLLNRKIMRRFIQTGRL